jgi:hypothetical protein
MSVSKIGINEEGNQANHQRQHQGILCPVKIAPTKSDDRPALRGDDFRLKKSITSGFTGRQEPFPADPVQPLVCWSFHRCFSNSEKGISFRNPFLP